VVFFVAKHIFKFKVFYYFFKIIKMLFQFFFCAISCFKEFFPNLYILIGFYNLIKKICPNFLFINLP
jgi:hypothetical protein